MPMGKEQIGICTKPCRPAIKVHQTNMSSGYIGEGGVITLRRMRFEIKCNLNRFWRIFQIGTMKHCDIRNLGLHTDETAGRDDDEILCAGSS